MVGSGYDMKLRWSYCMETFKTVRVGDIYFELETGRRRRVRSIGTHGLFVSFDEWYNDEWIMNTNPERMEVVLTNLENFVIIPDTEAARLFYDKK